MKIKTNTLFISLASALILSACGGSDSPTPSPTPTPEPTPVSAELSTIHTLMGLTYTVTGNATVLLSNDSNLSIENRDFKDFTLYTFDNDEVDTSNCVDDTCISNWPPLLATGDEIPEAPLSIIERADGNSQWALHGLPLYFFTGDTEAGQINGEGLGGVWHTAVTQPAAFVKETTNEQDGVYLVAPGEILVSKQQEATVFEAVTENRRNMSLYTFDVDAPGVSNCDDECLNAWPALLAQEGDTAEAPYSIIDRTLGSTGEMAKQWALNGEPLYFFVGDTMPGETNGTEIENWHLARPASVKTTESERGSLLSGAGSTHQAVPNDEAEETSPVPADGMSLYIFDGDMAGEASQCSGECLTSWPALMAQEGAVARAPYSLIARASGEHQWALNGMPLYFFAGDDAPGDISGDEIGGVWHLARFAPVAAVAQQDESVLFTAHGELINEQGDADDTWADFTLYTFEQDTDGVSTCYEGCAPQWPPLFAPAEAKDFGDFTVTRRNDPDTPENEAIYQWAYKNQPLYFFQGDTQPGDTKGEYGTWFIARP